MKLIAFFGDLFGLNVLLVLNFFIWFAAIILEMEMFDCPKTKCAFHKIYSLSMGRGSFMIGSTNTLMSVNN